MKTIANALARNHIIGERINLPWGKLNRMLKLHTRELALIAGAPGSGKSVFAINMAMSTPLPVLYLAQDSAPSVLSRMAAIALDKTIDDVQDVLRGDKKDTMLAELSDVRPDLFIHDGALDYTAIALRIEALTEILGQAPPLVIIDNLIDTIVEGHHHQEVGFYANILNNLKQLALKHNTCIIALHHITRRGGDQGYTAHGLGTKPIRMTDLLYSGEREAEHVVGIYHNSNQERMSIQILKQRDGMADPEGNESMQLFWYPQWGVLDDRAPGND